VATSSYSRVSTSVRSRAWSTRAKWTMLGGVVWAFMQPYRLTFLHPHGQGFWWLLSEPPLYVVLVGLAFAVFLAPALIQDLEEAEDAAEG